MKESTPIQPLQKDQRTNYIVGSAVVLTILLLTLTMIQFHPSYKAKLPEVVQLEDALKRNNCDYTQVFNWASADQPETFFRYGRDTILQVAGAFKYQVGDAIADQLQPIPENIPAQPSRGDESYYDSLTQERALLFIRPTYFTTTPENQDKQIRMQLGIYEAFGPLKKVRFFQDDCKSDKVLAMIQSIKPLYHSLN